VQIKINVVDREIRLNKLNPFFQIQPVFRDCYADDNKKLQVQECSENNFGGLTSVDWEGLKSTIRSANPTREHRIGRYAVGTRKRTKS
jgi:hypothetical protein